MGTNGDMNLHMTGELDHRSDALDDLADLDPLDGHGRRRMRTRLQLGGHRLRVLLGLPEDNRRPPVSVRGEPVARDEARRALDPGEYLFNQALPGLFLTASLDTHRHLRRVHRCPPSCVLTRSLPTRPLGHVHNSDRHWRHDLKLRISILHESTTASNSLLVSQAGGYVAAMQDGLPWNEVVQPGSE